MPLGSLGVEDHVLLLAKLPLEDSEEDSEEDSSSNTASQGGTPEMRGKPGG